MGFKALIKTGGVRSIKKLIGVGLVFINSTKKEYEMVNDNRDVYGRWINSNNPRITKSQEQTNTCLWKFLNSFLEKKT